MDTKDIYSGEELYNTAEFTLNDYFHVIKKRYWLIIITVLMGLAFTLFIELRKKPVYSASGQINIKTASEYYNLNAIKFLSFSMNSYSNMIQSHDLISRALEHKKIKVSSGWVKSRLKVSFKPGSFTILISMKGEDPVLISSIVNAIIDEIIFYSKKMAKSKFENALVLLKEQMKSIEASLKKSEKELKDFEIMNGIPDEKRKYEGIQNNIADLSRQLTDVKVQKEEVRITLENILERLGQPSIDAEGENQRNLIPPITAQNDLVIRKLVKKREQLLKIYKPAHPKIEEINTQIHEAKSGQLSLSENKGPGIRSTYSSYQEKATELRLKLASLEIREKTLAEMVNKEKLLLKIAPDNNLKYQELKRKVEISRNIYSRLLGKYGEMEVMENTSVARVEVLNYSKAPEKPEYSRLQLTIFIAVIACFFLGVALTFLAENLDTSFKNHDELEKILGCPVLGLLPKIDDFHIFEDSIKENRDVDRKVVSLHCPNHLASESINSLRINLKFTLDGRDFKRVMVVSPVKASGKTLISANLAVSYAKSGARTLLIDCDLRKPMQHLMFGLDNIDGLTSYFFNPQGDSIIHKNVIPKLDILTSGLIPENPIELLESSRMDEVLDYLGADYDKIILDVPPVLGIPDSMVLAQKVEALVYLVSLRGSKMQQGKAGMKLLRGLGVEVNGLICNMVKKDELAGYYYRYT
jgi:capsular exopolysaccharide synthesis family protein